MAKIDISYDTISKEIFTTIDGAPISEVEYISFETYDGQNRMYISFKSIEMDGMNINTNINAKKHSKKYKNKEEEIQETKSAYSSEHYILTTSDGHTHHYQTSSPFTSVSKRHFHGVVGDEVISSDDHTHTLQKLDSVVDVHGDIESRLLGHVFDYDGKKNVYFETSTGVKLGSWEYNQV
jgi:hypothetical protein